MGIELAGRLRAGRPDPVYWSVPRIWPNETVFLLGGGPSSKTLDLEQLRGRRVIAINRMFRLALFADVLYFCDANYWTVDGDEIMRDFAGDVITIGRTVHPRVKVLRNAGIGGLCVDPSGLKHGSNSGYQAINLAYHFGAARIVLIGYDMQVTGDETHAHGGYGSCIKAPQMDHILKRRMLPYFPRLHEPLRDAGVQVYNVNPLSALRLWPFVSFDEALRLC